MARVTGLEPAASGVTGRRSNQLSYTRVLVGGKYDMALTLSMVQRKESVQKTINEDFSARPICFSNGMADTEEYPESLTCANLPHPHTEERYGRAADGIAVGGKGWWAMTGSNRRPSRCKRDALPLS
jgi:hypothetical protein